MSIQERASERFKRQARIGAERNLARKRAMIDYYGPGGTEMKQAEQAELYGQMASDMTGEMAILAIQRGQRPYRSMRGTAAIPIPVLDWDRREWAKRNAAALKRPSSRWRRRRRPKCRVCQLTTGARGLLSRPLD